MSEFVMSILSHSQINKGLFIVKKLEIIFVALFRTYRAAPSPNHAALPRIFLNAILNSLDVLNLADLLPR